MDRQTGKNQAFNAAGNCFAALVIGLIGYFLGLHWMFYLIIGLCAAAIFCVLRVKDSQINYDLAREADDENPNEGKDKKKEEAQDSSVLGSS